MIYRYAVEYIFVVILFSFNFQYFLLFFSRFCLSARVSREFSTFSLHVFQYLFCIYFYFELCIILTLLLTQLDSICLFSYSLVWMQSIQMPRVRNANSTLHTKRTSCHETIIISWIDKWILYYFFFPLSPSKLCLFIHFQNRCNPSWVLISIICMHCNLCGVFFFIIIFCVRLYHIETCEKEMYACLKPLIVLRGHFFSR